VWLLAFCRAGIDCESFSDDELALMRFCVAFMDDAFQRMFLPSPRDEDIAHLDYWGHIVSAGAKIQETFDELFGRNASLTVSGEKAECRLAFLGRYRRFLARPFDVGMDRATLSFRNRRYAFLFSLARSADSQLRQEGIPFASVRLVSVATEHLEAGGMPRIEPDASWQFTARELEVLDGIYAGKSNKGIASELGVDESSVTAITSTRRPASDPESSLCWDCPPFNLN
jgi:hypothetical protein